MAGLCAARAGIASANAAARNALQFVIQSLLQFLVYLRLRFRLVSHSQPRIDQPQLIVCLRNVGPQFQRTFQGRARPSDISLTQPDHPQFLLGAAVVRVCLRHLFQTLAGRVKISLALIKHRQVIARVIVLRIKLQAAGELLP